VGRVADLGGRRLDGVVDGVLLAKGNSRDSVARALSEPTGPAFSCKAGTFTRSGFAPSPGTECVTQTG